MSLMLSRPFIINSDYCSVEMPNLRLETDGTQADLPSPIVPIALQCQLGRALTKIPGVIGGIVTPTQAVAVQQETEKWLAAFPPAFQLTDPDTRWDSDYNYIEVQRIQLHTIAYLVMLMPLKRCLTKSVDQGSASIEKSLQPTAVGIALKLMEASRRLLDCMEPSNTNPHFAPFAMFDTAAILCSAVIHDRHRCLPQRERILRAIAIALDTLEHIGHSTKTAAIFFSVLTKLVNNLTLSPEEHTILQPKKPADSAEGPKTSETRLASENVFGDINGLLPSDELGIGLHASLTPRFPYLEGLVPSPSDLTDLFNVDLGELGQIWDLDNLGLNFGHNIPA
ncbi:uncharacterized protein ACLA_023930 [Aspergillus clavatus NRRL 1]|uniref:Uncharacterized protein n=1 Tax=Aspergillus clavatus (strain ATCC 1007 / CBS 513.65 / DSM 816 / NCTC 3887 / NRRL 1 / QM 1276 / 107) TaxID=344612 RepID=A1CPV7_ASPCL|nr:uncharacterized protein ACLA_023930 [Aspergillus clavatus NRRL 1]EAW07678.1 conserved hypothetical protein [Aspergillus clavatus NRRL 1]